LPLVDWLGRNAGSAADTLGISAMIWPFSLPDTLFYGLIAGVTSLLLLRAYVWILENFA
jgi:hypothetical protein